MTFNYFSSLLSRVCFFYLNLLEYNRRCKTTVTAGLPVMSLPRPASPTMGSVVQCFTTSQLTEHCSSFTTYMMLIMPASYTQWSSHKLGCKFMSKFYDFTNMAVASYISQAINFLPNHLAASVEKPVMNKKIQWFLFFQLANNHIRLNNNRFMITKSITDMWLGWDAQMPMVTELFMDMPIHR